MVWLRSLLQALCWPVFIPRHFLIFKDSFLWLFAATMLALGVVLEQRELRETIRQPRQITLGVLTQFSVMPTFAFCVAYFGGLSPEQALGFIIVGCAPGAMASNVIVYLVGGAVAYSVALTTVATAMSPVVTPVLVEILGGAFMPIPFWPMMKTTFLIVLLPLLLGIGLQRILGRFLIPAKEIAPAIAAIAIVIICGYAVASNQERVASIGLKVFALVVLLNAMGFAAGWFLAAVYRFDSRHQLTLSVEIGMQNAGLGVALALKHFTPETALPGTIFAVWCILTAAGAGTYLRLRSKTN